MKTTQSHSSARAVARGKHAFTLIELLAVIFIISVLVGILLPVLLSVKQKGKEEKAKAERNTIASAAIAYHIEYGEWPCPVKVGTTTNDVSYSNNNAVILKDYLRPDSTYNPKKILFLPDGCYRTNNSGTLIDPWGRPYLIVFDTGGDGMASNSWQGVYVRTN